jgi:hypothetical protein
VASGSAARSEDFSSLSRKRSTSDPGAMGENENQGTQDNIPQHSGLLTPTTDPKRAAQEGVSLLTAPLTAPMDPVSTSSEQPTPEGITNDTSGIEVGPSPASASGSPPGEGGSGKRARRKSIGAASFKNLIARKQSEMQQSLPPEKAAAAHKEGRAPPVPESSAEVTCQHLQQECFRGASPATNVKVYSGCMRRVIVHV